MNSIFNRLMFVLPFFMPAFILFMIVMPKLRKTSPEFQEKARNQMKIMSYIVIAMMLVGILLLIFGIL